jgi:hypothetical protein
LEPHFDGHLRDPRWRRVDTEAKRPTVDIAVYGVRIVELGMVEAAEGLKAEPERRAVGQGCPS